jgi:hypothetical protein
MELRSEVKYLRVHVTEWLLSVAEKLSQWVDRWVPVTEARCRIYLERCYHGYSTFLFDLALFGLLHYMLLCSLQFIS